MSFLEEPRKRPGISRYRHNPDLCLGYARGSVHLCCNTPSTCFRTCIGVLVVRTMTNLAVRVVTLIEQVPERFSSAETLNGEFCWDANFELYSTSV